MICLFLFTFFQGFTFVGQISNVFEDLSRNSFSNRSEATHICLFLFWGFIFSISLFLSFFFLLFFNVSSHRHYRLLSWRRRRVLWTSRPRTINRLLPTIWRFGGNWWLERFSVFLTVRIIYHMLWYIIQCCILFDMLIVGHLAINCQLIENNCVICNFFVENHRKSYYLQHYFELS